ncbi:MAG: hypothetical protein KF724_02630 [Phycisphaeraceae bacterium]|nr:hypothetical protein [Phycisphaeraceae bacterium]
MKTHRSIGWRSLPASLLVAVAGALLGAAGCEETHPTAQQPPNGAHPNAAPVASGSTEKNPISGNRKSTLGKAYDVAENLVDEKIPEYNRRIEEQLNPGKK